MMKKKIVGYADQISVAPGDTIRFMVSCEDGVDNYSADIVRLISGDTQPGGPGHRDEVLETPVSGMYAGRKQDIHCGSYGVVPHAGVFEDLKGRDDPDVRADIVYFETPNGGAVFSNGSIGWCCALFHNGYDNNVSRITRNVLERFLDPKPLD